MKRLVGGAAAWHWAVGIEDTFVPQPHPRTGRVLDEYALAQHYRFWRLDLDLAASLGVTAMRWGVPWHRVEPAPGRFDWNFTDRVLHRLAELRISPIVDLVHYGCPSWLELAFLHPDYPERVARYAAAFAERYRDLAHAYTPLNEPVVTAAFCGETATWPPNLRGRAGYVRVLMRVCEGMSRTIEALRSVQRDALIVQVEATAVATPAEPALRPLAEATWRRHLLPTELVLGRVGDDHPSTAQLLADGAGERELQLLRSRPQTIDVMGVNYYPHLSSFTITSATDATPAFVRRRGSGADLRDVLERFNRAFGVPVMVTETSDRAPAWRRAHWLVESVAAVRGARADGIPVVGYTWWPLYCLFDWRWRKGTADDDTYICRMGLYDLRRDAEGTLRRVPTALVEGFRELTAAGAPS